MPLFTYNFSVNVGVVDSSGKFLCPLADSIYRNRSACMVISRPADVVGGAYGSVPFFSGQIFIVWKFAFFNACPVDHIALVRADCNTSGLVVSRDYDESLVRMLKIEIVCNRDSFIEP